MCFTNGVNVLMVTRPGQRCNVDTPFQGPFKDAASLAERHAFCHHWCNASLWSCRTVGFSCREDRPRHNAQCAIFSRRPIGASLPVTFPLYRNLLRYTFRAHGIARLAQSCVVFFSLSCDDFERRCSYKFLELVLEYTLLYDKMDFTYKDKDAKMNHWTIIGQEFSLTGSQAASKFKNGRDRWKKMNLAVNRTKKNSTEGQDHVIRSGKRGKIIWKEAGISATRSGEETRTFKCSS